MPKFSSEIYSLQKIWKKSIDMLCPPQYNKVSGSDIMPKKECLS